MEALASNLGPESFLVMGFAAAWFAGMVGSFVRWLARGVHSGDIGA